MLCSLVPVTKPIIQLSSNRTVLSPGMDLTLTCLARGSPPITYQWFKIVPVDAGVQIGEEAALRFERLEPFHAGRYYCKAKNQIDGPRVEQSDTVQVPVEGEAPTCSETLFGGIEPVPFAGHEGDPVSTFFTLTWILWAKQPFGFPPSS